MKRLFMLLLMIFYITTAFAQNIIATPVTESITVTPAIQTITKAEYFFETDPGPGNGFQVRNFSPADTVNFTFNIPLSSLPSGFHILFMRVCDTVGRWSMVERRFFYISSNTTTNTANITAAEYFFDTDPGAGNGTPTSVGAAGAVVNFPVMIPATLSAGFHFLAIRTRDADGKWGFSDTRNFYLAPPPAADMPSITAAEYFYDHDPGAGNGTALNITSPGNVITQTFMVPVPDTMTASNHFLTIRVKDQAGHWSLFEKDTVTVSGTTATITCPGNVTIDPFTNQCKAVVFHIDAVGLPEDDSSYTYTLTGATTGSGIGTASGQVLFNPGVTTVTYALINSPAVSCSFTVTVNSSVTPTATVSVPYTTFCEGTLVSFTALGTGSGFNPSWQWKKNGVNVGSNINFYRDSTLANNDTITVSITSSISCANPPTVTSPAVVMTVPPMVTPSISISASSTTICPGQLVTFTAAPTNGGSHPIYQWIWNGHLVGTDSVYQSSTLANGDSVFLIMNSNAYCTTISQVWSNVIHMTTSQVVAPLVSITTPQTTICSGTQVTFTATPTNGGSTPSYQWKLNGSNVGSNSPTYQNTALQNGDSVKVIMTSSLACASQPTATSNSIVMSVGQTITPSVSIQASAATICSGQLVTFTATPTNGGITPHYQWRINGNSVGTDSPTYQTSTLQNGDSIVVYMTPVLPCATQELVVSNTIFITVSQSATPSVSITSSATTICPGQQVTFTAMPINGGSSPIYEWTLNNNVVGTNSNTYQSSALLNGDVVKVTMSSSLSCANHAPVSSNAITMTVTSSVTPSVTITASATTICSGTQVTFTAMPTNGGSNPHYEWTVNGNEVGANSSSYQNSTLANGDSIKVYMISSSGCASPALAVSNTITMAVTSLSTYYRDVDGDGYGSSASGTIQSCGATAGYVANNSDCNDNNAAVHPGATDICGNGIDDNCNGLVDENCNSRLPVLMLRTYPAKEGDAGLTLLNVEVTLDTIATSPVSVNYATHDGDAIAGLDYVATSGVLVIPAGSSSASIQLRIIGDLLKEGNERFTLRFSNPVNVVLPADPRSEIMIIDNDRLKIINGVTRLDKTEIEEQLLKIPSVTRRNEIWMIPQIGMYKNEVVIMNAQGQPVNRFVNYQNHAALSNVAAGLYFYSIRLVDDSGQVKYYSGRLLITE
jgi:Calx-beta domain/Putative metal-binding motif